MPRISDLDAMVAPNNNDELAIVDKAGVITKKIKRGDLLSGSPLPADTVDTQAIDDGAVTPAKRSGGFYASFIPAATMNSTGNKTITGVGFTPKLVEFVVLPPNSATVSRSSQGFATATYQATTAAGSGGTSSGTYSSNGTYCISGVSSTGGITVRASHVSFNSDGFVINVETSGSFDVGYKAYA